MINYIFEISCVKTVVTRITDLFALIPKYLYIPNVFNCLTFMWLICMIKVFFDLDMLKILPPNLHLNSYGKGKRLSMQEQLEDAGSKDTTRQILGLRDFKFMNNILDMYFNLHYFGDDKNEVSQAFNNRMYPYLDFLIIYVGPFLQAITATLTLIYVLTLMFSYVELFGYTMPDEPVILNKKEIEEIEAKVLKTEKEKQSKDKSGPPVADEVGFRLSEA